jgi:hypothetical protein
MAFAYCPLDSNVRAIRLIQLLPMRSLDSDDEAIFCIISYAFLDNPPQYTALSYTWGDGRDKVAIYVDGRTCLATRSLQAVLAQLRLNVEEASPASRNEREDSREQEGGEPPKLWIDALCINQQDEAEKTEQVRQMYLIYSRAERIISWLGPAADNSDTAMRWIRKYGTLALDLGIGTVPELRLGDLLRVLETDPDKLPLPEQREKLVAFLEAVSRDLKSGPEGGEDSVVWALSQLFDRAYWKRVWIVQEVVFGNGLQFVCGSLTVSVKQIHLALRLLRNFGLYQNLKFGIHHRSSSPSYSALKGSHHINILKVRMLKAAKPPLPFPSLLSLIRTFRHLQASDPRDKIFALLNFSSDAEGFGLQPDYRKSYQEVYVDTVSALVRNDFFNVMAVGGLGQRSKGAGATVVVGRLFKTAPGNMSAGNQYSNKQTFNCKLATARV